MRNKMILAKKIAPPWKQLARQAVESNASRRADTLPSNMPSNMPQTMETN